MNVSQHSQISLYQVGKTIRCLLKCNEANPKTRLSIVFILEILICKRTQMKILFRVFRVKKNNLLTLITSRVCIFPFPRNLFLAVMPVEK